MDYFIGKEYRFEAAHHLPNHKGKCRNPHGHSYRVVVEVSGSLVTGEVGTSDHGMVMDYDDLDALVDPIIAQLDHTDLNETLGVLAFDDLLAFDGLDIPVPRTTTAEIIASVLFARIGQELPNRIELELVRVHETAKTYAEVTR